MSFLRSRAAKAASLSDEANASRYLPSTAVAVRGATPTVAITAVVITAIVITAVAAIAAGVIAAVAGERVVVELAVADDVSQARPLAADFGDLGGVVVDVVEVFDDVVGHEVAVGVDAVQVRLQRVLDQSVFGRDAVGQDRWGSGTFFGI